jgi:hypothetical protein
MADKTAEVLTPLASGPLPKAVDTITRRLVSLQEQAVQQFEQDLAKGEELDMERLRWIIRAQKELVGLARICESRAEQNGYVPDPPSATMAELLNRAGEHANG